MANNRNNADDAGIFQLDNGYWGYRYVIKSNGQRKDGRRTVDDLGKPFKTKAAAKRARKQAILNEKIALANPQPKVIKKTVSQVYDEYCEFGRAGKAYATI